MRLVVAYLELSPSEEVVARVFRQERRKAFALFVGLLIALGPACPVFAQETLGGIAGVVRDTSGGVVVGATVEAVNEGTQTTRTLATSRDGAYAFVDLPIGSYTLTYTHAGFATQKTPSVAVQADRTATVNVALQIGEVSTSITVEAATLMNTVDTTTGYVLDHVQIESIPLPTGSFTGLALLSAGVNAELPGGTGANSGLGNLPIWANGQRDTSNSFLINGVDASNLFNGKSTSQVNSARVVNGTNTGLANNPGVIQSGASVYLAIGQALPTPAPETIAEMRINTSGYDAQQGFNSGAHIDVSTASGTNAIHGSAYLHRGTDWLNAAPLFFKADPHIPDNEKVPELHRVIAGATLSAPIVRDKLFGFLSYQHLHTSDQEIGISRLTVPLGLADDNRTGQGLADLANSNFATPTGQPLLAPSQISPVALALFQARLPNGQYLIPSANGPTPTAAFADNAVIPGTAFFLSDQAIADLDWNVSGKDTLAAKYYYQHDPSISPYALSNVAGFTTHTDAGSQVFSLTNAQQLGPRFNLTETLGFLREKAYVTNSQPFTPDQVGINSLGSSYFPGITISDIVGNSSPNNPGVFNASLNIGAGPTSQGAYTGVFQNRLNPSVNAIATFGHHTFTAGGSFAYTQLNVRNNRTNKGMIESVDLYQFVQGLISPYANFLATAFLHGDANRYYRANQTGVYLQDKYQVQANLSLSFGIRFDDNGGLSEKNGRIFNFDPSRYVYNDAAGVVSSNGLIVAGNNKQSPTAGVSNSTLTGRQWGLAPRVGFAWSPEALHQKVVIRGGTGFYYDRGELFSYLSPSYAVGLVDSGPFGVTQAPPFVNAQTCTSLNSPYENFFATCDPNSPTGGSLANPFGAVLGPAPSGNPADISNYLPAASQIMQGAPLFSLGVYDHANKLPYSINNTFGVQWQPRPDLALEVNYVGNLGRHLVIPIPFNQPGIASPSHPIHGQQYTYGYQVQGPPGCAGTCAPAALPNAQGNYLATYEGGNTDLRVPYVGFSAESEAFRANGISAYNALQTHVEKRMSHGFQIGGSYTYSHALDEQSALGLIYNGNNPMDLRSGYASSDFDRTHVFSFNYVYQLPKLFRLSTLADRVFDGWAVQGVGILQSGQPYSVVDFSGAVGSIFYSVNDNVTNPIAPLKAGCSAKNAKTKFNGLNGPALDANCFTVPLLAAGDLNGAIPPDDSFETNFTTGERNLFRQTWQKRTDMSFVKATQLSDRFAIKYTLDLFNLTNTASLDVPSNFIFQNSTFNGAPISGTTPLVPGGGSGSFYQPASGLGLVHNTIGSARQIQMSLHLSF